MDGDLTCSRCGTSEPHQYYHEGDEIYTCGDCVVEERDKLRVRNEKGGSKMKNEIKEAIDNDIVRRITRADMEELEMRLLNITIIANNVNLPELDRINLIHEIASGHTLEEIIRDAGMKALGLDAGEQGAGYGD